MTNSDADSLHIPFCIENRQAAQEIYLTSHTRRWPEKRANEGRELALDNRESNKYNEGLPGVKMETQSDSRQHQSTQPTL